MTRRTLDNSFRKVHGPHYWPFLLLGLAAPLLLFPKLPFQWLGVGLIGTGWLVRWRSNNRIWYYTGTEFPAIFLLLFAGLGYWISLDRGLSIPRFWSMVLGLAIFVFLSQGAFTSRQLRIALIGVVFLTIGILIVSLIGTDWRSSRIFNILGLYQKLPEYHLGLPNSGLPGTSERFNPRAVGMTMGILAPFLAAVAIFGKSPPDNHPPEFIGISHCWLFGVPAALALFMLLFSQSLQALAGVFFGFWLLLLWRTRRAWLMFPFVFLVVLIIVLIYTPSTLVGFLFSMDNPIGVAISLRLDIWSRALAMLRELPFTGIGLNNFSLVQSEFFPGYQLGLEPHAHNLYLQTALDMGVPGLITWIWLLTAWYMRVVRNLHTASQPLRQAVLIGVITGVSSYLFCGLFDALVIGSKSGVCLWLLLGLGLAPSATSDFGEIDPSGTSHLGFSKSPAPIWRRWLLPGLTVLILPTLFLIFPGPIEKNRSILMAQQVLHKLHAAESISMDQLTAARQGLQNSLTCNSKDIYAWELLGQVDAWLGDPAAAIEAFSNRVELDGYEPIARYDPAGFLVGRSQNDGGPDPNWPGLARIYSQWQIRYPQHAEHWLRTSLVYELYLDDPVVSAALIRQGLHEGARPRQILLLRLKRLQAAR